MNGGFLAAAGESRQCAAGLFFTAQVRACPEDTCGPGAAPRLTLIPDFTFDPPPIRLTRVKTLYIMPLT